MSREKIIIDTDPGQDDAVAILLALASPEELDLLAITCVAGNVPLALTARNARMVCELAGRRDIPVFAGCDRPLGRALVTAEHVHGKTGLDGPDLPEPTMPLQDSHAVDHIIACLR
ncbi:MAG TPA: nucleoside hydrolase, partial [Roseovarius nubinhibens]|nr:nucleoside hydrolase [Roseovarius nubinhibens]